MLYAQCSQLCMHKVTSLCMHNIASLFMHNIASLFKHKVTSLCMHNVDAICHMCMQYNINRHTCAAHINKNKIRILDQVHRATFRPITKYTQ